MLWACLGYIIMCIGAPYHRNTSDMHHMQAGASTIYAAGQRSQLRTAS